MSQFSELPSWLLASFTITNTNFIPLTDVGASFAVEWLVLGSSQNPSMGNLITQRNPHLGLRLTRDHWLHHDLRMDERFTITLAEVFILGDLRT
jgi:hypothetical protein